MQASRTPPVVVTPQPEEPSRIRKLVGFNILCTMTIALGVLAILFEALLLGYWSGELGIFHTRASGIWCGLWWFLTGFFGLFLVPRAYVKKFGNARYIILLLMAFICMLMCIYLLTVSSINAYRVPMYVCEENWRPDELCVNVKLAKAFYVLLAVLSGLELIVVVILALQCFFCFANRFLKREDKMTLVSPGSNTPPQAAPAPSKHTPGQTVTPIAYHPRYSYYHPQY